MFEKDELRKFMQAWSDHDIDALMSYMTEDCEYYSSGGDTEWGGIFIGYEDVKKAYASIWQVYPDARWQDDFHWIDGDRGGSSWVFTGTKADGTTIRVRGCDWFVFEGKRIKRKDSYRKNLII